MGLRVAARSRVIEPPQLIPGRLHHIGIGGRLGGARVLMLVHELDIRVITEDTGELLRAFTLDNDPRLPPQQPAV
jgi:hypothetical protein